MKLTVTAIAAVALLGIASGTASAQYPAVVPHRSHYHVVPAYSPPRIAYVVPTYSPGVTIGGFYSSRGIGIGVGGIYGRPVYSGGYGHGYGGHHDHYHGHHGHHR